MSEREREREREIVSKRDRVRGMISGREEKCGGVRRRCEEE